MITSKNTRMPSHGLLRRRLLLASLSLPILPALQGCAAPLPKLSATASTADAQALLTLSATAHGLAALSGLSDVNVSYAGHWRPVVGKLQPALVDDKYRGSSEERILLREPVVGQSFTGPNGHKQVIRRTEPHGQGQARVWFNDEETHDADKTAAAALVADGYGLFLLGPMLLARPSAGDRSMVMQLGTPERDHDVLRIRLTPGLGFSDADELALYIDRTERLMRRVRFTLNGLESTRGAIAEVECYDHVTLHGVRWPTRFYERLLRPVPLPVHNWHLTGLDVNRGLIATDVGQEFSTKARLPAASLPSAR